MASGLVLLLSLFFFGRTKPNPSSVKPPVANNSHEGHSHAEGEEHLDTKTILESAKARLNPQQQAWLTTKENSIVRGDLVGQKIQLYTDLINFWRDSARVFEPFIYYLGEKSKLENSEKSLTFAAHLYLKQLKSVEQHELQIWMADQAAALFKQALQLNPENDSSSVGLGSCYIYGASGASTPMEGIQKILAVAQKDSTNMYAQFMLGYGGIMTGQLDKAIERLKKVVTADPNHTEAVFLLAEAYERSGKNKEAVVWYEKGKAFVQNPEALKEIDARIKELSQ